MSEHGNIKLHYNFLALVDNFSIKTLEYKLTL